MNYKHALTLNVEWEKMCRPELKQTIENCKESVATAQNQIISANEDIEQFETYKKGRDELLNAEEKVAGDETEADFTDPFIRYWIMRPLRSSSLYGEEDTLAFVWKCCDLCDHEFLEKQLEHIKSKLRGFNLTLKEQKKEIMFLSYVYNIDVENAEKYFKEWKDASYLTQEFLEEHHSGQVLQLTSSCGGAPKLHKGESGYNELCKRDKNLCEMMELLIRNIKLLRDVVKPILKAGKRMNKRKGKKNRG